MDTLHYSTLTRHKDAARVQQELAPVYERFKWTRASVRRNRLTAEYEPLQPFFLLALAERAGCQTFIDVGANIGAYSLFATLVPSVSRVVAFEADPTTLAELRQNVSLNSLEDRVDVHGNAVSDGIKTVAFGKVGYLSGANSIVSTSIHEPATFRESQTVETTTLDHVLVDGALGPLAIKIDVEGHEPAVLEGATSVLRENPVVVQIECYGEAGRETRRRLRDLGIAEITSIGPDHFFTNIESIRDPVAVIRTYEQAAGAMIACGHRDRPVTLEKGDLKLEIIGKTAELARRSKKLFRG
jgi:FkbM family methyltransferase